MERLHRRVVFDAVALERFRVSKNLSQQAIADFLGVTVSRYGALIRRFYISFSNLEKFKQLETHYNIDLSLDDLGLTTVVEVEDYIYNKYTSVRRKERGEVVIECYPKHCERCCWRRGTMCLTPLCMKRGNEYDPTMAWGSHLEIYRGTNKS